MSSQSDGLITISVQGSSKKRKRTSFQIAAVLRAASIIISTRSARRRTQTRDLYSHMAAKKPLMGPINVLKRLSCAKKHAHWTIEDWRNVLWPDEASIEMFWSKRKAKVRKR